MENPRLPKEDDLHGEFSHVFPYGGRWGKDGWFAFPCARPQWRGRAGVGFSAMKYGKEKIKRGPWGTYIPSGYLT